MSLVLVGLSHQTASLSVREKVVYSPEEAVNALRALKTKDSVPQALLLSTCNRTELYAMVPDPEAAILRMKEDLFLSRIPRENGNGEDILYDRTGPEAVAHLFRVVCGLESLVLGEQEILHQVKTAYEISRDADVVGSVFHKLATRAFHIGKRARSETHIGMGAVSVAFAGVELAEKVFQSLEGRGALLVGAGENGALCAQHLLSRGVDPFVIANRTLAKAEALAQRLGGETVSLDQLGEAMSRVDVVVTTTGSSEAMIGPELIKEVMHKRDSKSLVIIDIAVPRDVDPVVDEIRNVFRFDMDAINTIVDRTLTRRRKEVPVVEKMVEMEVAQFMNWWRSLAAGPVIRDINRAFDAVRDVEVEKNAKRFVDEDREQLTVFSRNLVRKLLMGLTTEIKNYRPDNPVEMERLAALRRAFRLDEEESDDVDAP